MKKPLLLLAMMIGVASFAQTTYTISTYTSTYSELVNASPVELLEDWEEEYWDDPLFFVPLEFGFEVGDSTYNSIIQFGSGADMLIANLNYVDSTLTSPLVHLFGIMEDFADAAAIPGLTPSEITHNTTGVAGSRIMKLQYKDAAFYDEVYGPEPAAENRMNFQMWFYEDNGIMEIHFGESNIPNPELAFYDNPGPGILIATDASFDDGSVGWGAIVIGNTSNPTLLQVDMEEEPEESLNGVPESGRVYRFTPSINVGLSTVNGPEFSLYPTIAQSEIWVKDAKVANAAYRIMDITGKQVKADHFSGNTSVNISDLNAGVYIFSIDGMSHAVKFVKK